MTVVLKQIYWVLMSLKHGDIPIMQKTVLKAALVILIAGLTSCSNYMSDMSGEPSDLTSPSLARQGVVAKSVDQAGNETNVNVTMTGGGEIGAKSMTADDKVKMSRALDAGTGKATHWQNGATGISYTVTPIKKVVIQGNPFCRSYSVVAERGGRTKESSGTACVTTDGSWHTV